MTGSARHVVRQLRDFLGLGFTGFNFVIGAVGQNSVMQRIAEEVLRDLRSTAVEPDEAVVDLYQA